MVAEFAIYPMGESHYSKIIAEVVQEIKNSGLEFRLGPMGTSIEGEADELFHVIQKCFQLVDKSHDRVIMQATFDNKDISKRHVMEGMVKSVLSKVGEINPGVQSQFSKSASKNKGGICG